MKMHAFIAAISLFLNQTFTFLNDIFWSTVMWCSSFDLSYGKPLQMLSALFRSFLKISSLMLLADSSYYFFLCKNCHVTEVALVCVFTFPIYLYTCIFSLHFFKQLRLSDVLFIQMFPLLLVFSSLHLLQRNCFRYQLLNYRGLVWEFWILGVFFPQNKLNFGNMCMKRQSLYSNKDLY